MKTTAFLTRVAICFLLSLIPVTEMENRIYSARLQFSGWLKLRRPEIIIIEINSDLANLSDEASSIHSQIKLQKPALVLIGPHSYSKHLLIDPDGVIRRAALFPKGQPTMTYSADNRPHLNIQLTNPISEPHLIYFLGPSGTFSRCTPTGNLRQTCPSLENKIVLISEINEASLTFQTPLGEMSPSEILANDIQTRLNHEAITLISTIEKLAITLVFILLGSFFIIYYPVLVSALAITATGMVILIFLFQIIFQLFSIYIPSANMICSLLITYLVFTGYRLALQENLQWRSLKQAQYLRELDQMKTNFLSLVSHDLKTPLAKIQAIVERLRRELNLPLDERTDWKEHIDSIENSNNEMKRFVTSILSLSKMESQKVILNKKSNDINSLILQALQRLRPIAQQKQIQIEESLEPLFSIECDEDLMRQVITNLIDNAIKYSPPHSKVIVRSKEEDGFLRVEVEDFGLGIPRDQLPLMFRKFSRFMRPIKEQVKGTGLGLYLSKYFIELHGGTIRVKSIEGEGTTFTFTLPLRGTEDEAILG